MTLARLGCPASEIAARLGCSKKLVWLRLREVRRGGSSENEKLG